MNIVKAAAIVGVSGGGGVLTFDDGRRLDVVAAEVGFDLSFDLTAFVIAIE